jgi:hypothetical protein
VTTNATAIAGIGAQYTVLLDANGYVSGTKQLNAGPGASSFTVLADFFQVAKPVVAGGAPVPVITLGTVNGVQKLALRGDMLADGTITARNILAGSITADKLQANSIGTNQLAVGGVDITNLIAGAATQVTSHDGGALSLTAPGTLFDLVSSGPVYFPVACNVVIIGTIRGNGGSSSHQIPGAGVYPSEGKDMTFGIYVNDGLIPGSDLTFTWATTLAAGVVFPLPADFSMVVMGQAVIPAGTHTVKIKARYIRYESGVTDWRSYVRVTSAKMVMTQNRR